MMRSVIVIINKRYECAHLSHHSNIANGKDSPTAAGKDAADNIRITLNTANTQTHTIIVSVSVDVALGRLKAADL